MQLSVFLPIIEKLSNIRTLYQTMKNRKKKKRDRKSTRLNSSHGIAKGGDCKVEFNQPSCWLYSVPNLLVF